MNGNVFITGGTGFLGRGIMRYAQKESWDVRFTVYSRDEWKQQQCRSKYPARYILGDVCDYGRLSLAMTGHDTVIHTAALKYIPEGEVNASECVRVNIDGSRAVMEAARAAGVKNVIMISTDKAPQPVNTYGMTKAIVERLVQETWDTEGPVFTACRYGNVIGSTGSIWPVWKKQAESGPIQLTNPEMTRYFMSVDDAVRLIDASAAAPRSGFVVLPRPKAARIGPLSEYVANHLGVALNTVGSRPGEKIHEQMLSYNELSRLVPYASSYPYVALLPPTLKAENAEEAGLSMLTSAKPDRWLEPEQFVAIALDSEGV